MTAEQKMDFGFGEDEALVRQSARRFLDKKASIEAIRKLVAADHKSAYEGTCPPVYYDVPLWKEVVELGWTGLAVPEAAGGLGMSLAGIVGLVEEVGGHALPSALESTLIATFVVRAANTDSANAWLERIACGCSATLAFVNQAGSVNVADTTVTACEDGKQTRLDGTAWFVQDARKSDTFIVAARHDHAVAFYAVPANAPGVKIHPDRILDLTRDQARVEFDGVSVDPDGVLSMDGDTTWHSALPAILTVVAADIAGAAEHQLQTMVEYAKIRTQFDHPIGFFQAVKHPIVNVMLAVDETRSLVYDAAFAFDHEPQRAEIAARMAKASAAETALFASSRSMQIHGGIAMTWEADIHIHFKRQQHSRMLFGDAGHQRRVLANLMWD